MMILPPMASRYQRKSRSDSGLRDRSMSVLMTRNWAYDRSVMITVSVNHQSPWLHRGVMTKPSWPTSWSRSGSTYQVTPFSWFDKGDLAGKPLQPLDYIL